MSERIENVVDRKENFFFIRSVGLFILVGSRVGWDRNWKAKREGKRLEWRACDERENREHRNLLCIYLFIYCSYHVRRNS